MNIVYPLRSWSVALASVAAAVMVGCASDKNSSAKQDLFPADSQPSAVTLIMQEQIARGASNDATLRESHFIGGKLNTLGAAKLEAILADTEPSGKLTVYLSLPKEDVLATARQKAITDYVHSRGLTADQIAVTVGENPAVTAAASLNADRVYKDEAGSIRATPAILGGMTKEPSGSSDSSSSSSGKSE